MKKLFLGLATVLLIFSCKKEVPNYAIISGNIANAKGSALTLYSSSDRSYKQKITLKEDGSFKDTIKKFGEFSLYEGSNLTPVYLNPGNELMVTFDSKEHKNTLTISGTGAETSNYLLAKKNKESELKGKGADVYKKEEAEYKKVMNAIKTAQENLLSETKGISNEFKSKEKRRINYYYLNNLSKFKAYHSYYAKKPDYQPSEEFLSDLKGVDYTNEQDFTEFSDYKSLVSYYYQNEAKKIADKEGISEDVAMLKACSTIENQTIKNSLIYDASKYNITYTNDLEAFYKAYQEAGSTDAKNNKDIDDKYVVLKKTAKGNPSPIFENYENYKGGTTSLTDLRGKYVYIDVWATWCGPCKAEIPYLKEIEKQYHNKNITFLSISIDTKKDHQKWKDMVKEKELGGVQVFADNDWSSKFIKDYSILGIPKFILLDPKGKIVTPNAPRPSDKKLVELFESLNI